jgi:hypothetical protein
MLTEMINWFFNFRFTKIQIQRNCFHEYTIFFVRWYVYYPHQKIIFPQSAQKNNLKVQVNPKE